MFLSALFLIAVFQDCRAVIYHLNDTEYARMPPLYDLDKYEGCLLPDDGTFCIARFDLHADQDNELMTMIREYSNYDLKHYNHSNIDRGICVTKTCKTSIKKDGNVTDLGGTLEACLNASVWREYGLQTKLAMVYYCDKHGDERNIDSGDWVVAAALIAMVIINIIGSCYDIYISRTAPNDQRNHPLLSFSIFQNWQWLISGVPEDSRFSELKGLHGIRALTIMLVPLTHAMFINSMPFTENPHQYERLIDHPYYKMLGSGLMIIQIFFVMAGFLLVLKLQILSEKRQITWKLAAKIWLLRWFRLTPAYAALIAFTATWFRHLGSGPLWNLFVTNSLTRDCSRFWWLHMLFIQNYVPGVNTCLLHSWHMAVDVQLFCVGLTLYVMTRGCGPTVALSLLLMLGIVLPAGHVWLYDLDPLVLIKPEFFRTFINDTFFYMHIYGHNNLAAYAMGMGTGYLVYHLQAKRVNMINNKWCILLTWWILPSILGMLLSGNLFYLDGDRSSLVVRMVYAGLQRSIIGAIASFGIIICAMRINHPLRKFLEWPVWVVPSRLAYSVYLLHFNFITMHIALKTTLSLVSTYNMTLMHLSVLGLSFLLALPFYLMIEAPIYGMVKNLLNPREGESNAKEMA